MPKNLLLKTATVSMSLAAMMLVAAPLLAQTETPGATPTTTDTSGAAQ